MIRFVTALASEAEPLLRRYRMEPREGSFRWFRSDEGALVLSGVGKLRAAAATSYLHVRTGEEPLGLWLNVGIAGHRIRRPGELLVAHTIVDVGSGKRFFPTRPTRLDGSVEALELRTVDRPETEFDSDAAYDMEAAGFCETALRFSTTELVQSVKIVSDNLDTTTAGLNAETIRDLVESRADEVVSIATRFRTWARGVDPSRRECEISRDVELCRERWRFTTTEARKLRRLLWRFRVLADGAVPRDVLSRSRSGPEVLRNLEEELRHLSAERPL
jgi:adenosylhomocysteine nucleosidase